MTWNVRGVPASASVNAGSAGIKCPECGKTGGQVVCDSRDRGEHVRRRRVCRHCGLRFTTFERIRNLKLML